MARVPDLILFCREHGLKILTVAEIIRYRLKRERMIYRVAEGSLKTAYGEFRMIAYESDVNRGESHIALVRGDVEESSDPVLVRVHTRCTAGDLFGAVECDCHEVMQRSLKVIADAGRGAFIYLHNASPGFGVDKSSSPQRLMFHREMRAAEEHEARNQRILRSIGLGGQILSDLKIHKVRLLSNTPMHLPAIDGYEVEIVEQVPVSLEPLLARQSK